MAVVARVELEMVERAAADAAADGRIQIGSHAAENANVAFELHDSVVQLAAQLFVGAALGFEVGDVGFELGNGGAESGHVGGGGGRVALGEFNLGTQRGNEGLEGGELGGLGRGGELGGGGARFLLAEEGLGLGENSGLVGNIILKKSVRKESGKVGKMRKIKEK